MVNFNNFCVNQANLGNHNYEYPEESDYLSYCLPVVLTRKIYRSYSKIMDTISNIKLKKAVDFLKYYETEVIK